MGSCCAPTASDDSISNVVITTVSGAPINKTASKSNNSDLFYTLNQNYPNPFNPVTTISFSLKNPELVSLKIYDVLGKEASVLLNERLTEGNYNISFDGKSLSSGIYFYKIVAGSFTDTKKMQLLK